MYQHCLAMGNLSGYYDNHLEWCTQILSEKWFAIRLKWDETITLETFKQS